MLIKKLVLLSLSDKCRGIIPIIRSCSNVALKERLTEIINFKDTNISNWIVEGKIKSLCYTYSLFSKSEKNDFLNFLATSYGVDHTLICKTAEKLSSTDPINQNHLIARERSLRNLLTPPYHWLFIRMGRLENGVKFLVDLRTDTLQLISETRDSDQITILQEFDSILRDLLLLWFSVGFLHLQRITWQSPCDILQKISENEAIHPVRNWPDLKRRVGPYRRCFVFTHPSMPREPLVVLHTALCDLIPGSVKEIELSEKRILGKNEISHSFFQEDKNKIKAAIFYSIFSTQRGLQGIELGNYLIKEVAKQVTNEFPMIDQLSSLSPIPNFRLWLLEKIKQDPANIFTTSEQETLKNILKSNDLFLDLKKIFNNSLWTNKQNLEVALKLPLMRACAWYLYKEKRRNYALNNVANFHLRNGAVMWRLNWMADPSPRGTANSFGLMVNYRYFLEETESNSRNYIENKFIKASNSVINLAQDAEKLLL
ncbi:malonyl-CoA decarboxylase, mitochondrial-like isoform X2 [Leptopilina heterotoma]|uniref:malonyl-CoA decarboxylase, mitochondrial-like isoform X2 n=1 Tax=Leptopilina heterotoma TaxID=63436 RepID=UPI001CA9DBC9|nr:malonyl-CoA decarboxylase, mitochondrial-like isoform X2 [Leptopilina heterotoma]